MVEAGADAEVTSVRVSSTSHRVRIVAEDRAETTVDGEATVSTGRGLTTIDSVRSPIVVRVPEGTDLVVGTTAARVDVEGRVGDVAVVTESGRIVVEHAESLDARTNSGRVAVDRVVNECCVRTTSARVEVGACGDADVATASGRIVLKGVNGSVRAHCVSGRVDIEMDSAHDIDAETVSGRVNVSLPRGARAHQPTDPTDTAPRPAECDCTVNSRSVSGRVDVSSR